MVRPNNAGSNANNASVADEKDIIKVNKWDGTAVKNALDDAVKDVLTKKLNYIEDHRLIDTRLWICGIAVVVAMYALLWDYLHPFPASRNVLISCVGTYFVLMLILTLYTTFKEKGIFVVVIQKDAAGVDPESKWEASSNMKKFDDIYDLTLTFFDGKSGKSREDSIHRSVADFFDDNGLLCMDLVESAVMKMHKSLSSDKKDS